MELEVDYAKTWMVVGDMRELACESVRDRETGKGKRGGRGERGCEGKHVYPIVELVEMFYSNLKHWVWHDIALCS